jgi:HK97 family phage portal protein
MTDLLSRITARAKGYPDSPLYDLNPDLAYRIPVFRSFSDEQPGLSETTFPSNARDYIRSTWVHKAVKIVADNIAPHRIEIVRGEGEEKEPISDHPLRKILDNPNPSMSSSDLWRQWATDMLLGGEEGIEVTYNGLNFPAEFFPRQPNVFSIKPGFGGSRYRRVDYYRISDNEGDPYSLNPDQFIHTFFYNPLNAWRGIAPITAVKMGIVIDELAQAWSRLFFKNSARPDFAVLSDEGFSTKERIELETRIMNEFGGINRAHLPLILDQAVKDIKPLSYPPKDLEWIEQRKLSRDEIGAIFGVPDEIMGYGRDTYENFETAFRVFRILTVDPIIDFRDNVLSAWFRRYGYLESDLRLETERVKMPELPEDRDKKIASAKTLFDMGVPLNEANRRLNLGLREIEGGDVGYIPFSLVPVTGSVTEISPREPAEEVERGITAKWQYGQGAPPFGSEAHKDLLKRRAHPLEQLKNLMKRRLRRFYQQQEIRVGRAVRSSQRLGRGKFTKPGPGELLPELGSVFDLEKEIALFEEEFGPIVAEAVRLMGEFELAALGIELAFDVSRPEVRGAIAGLLNTVSVKTQNTVWTELIALFEEAEAAGEGIVAIQERLSAFYGGLKTDWQTERIARTTMTGAGNSGAQEAWDQTGVIKQRQWLSALLPGRTRIEHELAHGQTKGIREAFEVGPDLLQYPGDPNGSVGNIVNCLCSTVPVIDGELIVPAPE